MSYLDTINKLCEQALNPGKTVRDAMESSGKELVGCFPVHVPEEIIYATGCIPVGMWGGKTEIQLADKYLQSFCCSIMRINLELGMRGTYDMLKAVVIPTFCDTLKCMLENWKTAITQIPTIGMTYPQNRKGKAGITFTVSELKRVKDELEEILGRIITDRQVEEAFAVYEDYRKTMRDFTAIAADYPQIITAKKRHLLIKAGMFMDKAVYTQEMKEIIAGLRKEAPAAFSGTRVIVTGLLSEPVEVLEIFDEHQIAVVGDDLSLGSRLFRTPSRENLEDVYLQMAYRIADMKGDTFLYEEEKSKGQLLEEMVKKKKADAVVVMMMKFCDPEEFDYPIYKNELEQAGIPHLYLEIDQQLDTYEQIRTRVQSFQEMLI